jgi:hypothetical protein
MRRRRETGRHWAPPDRIPDQDQVLHPDGRRSADILRDVLEEPTQVVPVLEPLMTRGQEARSSLPAASGADVVAALLPELPWSTWCTTRHHSECDGTAPPEPRCYCWCHRGVAR